MLLVYFCVDSSKSTLPASTRAMQPFMMFR